MLFTLVSIAVSAEGYVVNSAANNTSQRNVSSGANASASVAPASAAALAVVTSANVPNATAKATNASAPYGAPGFEGILSLTCLMAVAYLVLGRIR